MKFLGIYVSKGGFLWLDCYRENKPLRHSVTLQLFSIKEVVNSNYHKIAPLQCANQKILCYGYFYQTLLICAITKFREYFSEGNKYILGGKTSHIHTKPSKFSNHKKSSVNGNDLKIVFLTNFNMLFSFQP